MLVGHFELHLAQRIARPRLLHDRDVAIRPARGVIAVAPRPGRIEREYELPFAEMGLNVNPRKLKTSPEFIQKREEILTLIWEMEEQIMNSQGGD